MGSNITVTVQWITVLNMCVSTIHFIAARKLTSLSSESSCFQMAELLSDIYFYFECHSAGYNSQSLPDQAVDPWRLDHPFWTNNASKRLHLYRIISSGASSTRTTELWSLLTSTANRSWFHWLDPRDYSFQLFLDSTWVTGPTVSSASVVSTSRHRR